MGLVMSKRQAVGAFLRSIRIRRLQHVACALGWGMGFGVIKELDFLVAEP